MSLANQRTQRREGVSFETYLRNWADHIRREQIKLKKLTEMSVTLHRRFRGLTLSDLCSRYGVRPETKGVWLEYDPDLDGEVHPINIVQPAIRANTNACLQSNAEVSIKAANASAKYKKIAERWQKVADYLERTGWSEEDRTVLFDAIQKDGTLLIYSYGVDSDSDSTVPDVSESTQKIAGYQCDCGAKGHKVFESDEEIPEGIQTMTCPECGEDAKGLIKSISSFALDEKQLSKTQIKHDLITFYNFCIDSYGAKRKGLDSAKFLQIHELIDRSELEFDYPQFQFGSPDMWSYQIQADYALGNAEWDYLNGQRNGAVGYHEFDRFERRKIYLHEDAYKNYVSPDNYEFVNGDGEKVFEIKRGQTIAEAWEEKYGENPEGLLYIWTNDRLIDIVSPEKEEINFRNCFRSVHWLKDSSGFHSSPNYSIVIIQDDVTLLNTMNHNITARNAVNPVYYNSLVFEESDFSQELVPTKNAALLQDGDISKAVTALPIPTPSPHLMGQLQFLWEVKDDITQVQPAMRGDAQKGETYGAQRQQLEQSYGLLTAVLKSFAQCKVGVTRHKFRIVKKKWTLEDFQRVASMFGEIWNDNDVQEMCAIDFDADLIMDYATGSEMPQSNLSREMKFFQGLSQLLPFCQANPQILSQDKWQKLLEKIDEFADFDFDLSGLEVDELISQKRIIELSKLCEQFGEVSLVQIEAAKQQIVSMDPQTGQPISKMDMIVEQIFNQSDIRFSKYENLEQQGKFFTEQLRAEIGKDKPNYLLIELMNTVLGLLEQAIQQIQQDAMANDPATIAQNQANEKAQLAAKQLADQQQNAKSADDEKQGKQKLIEKSADHDADIEKMQMQNAMALQQQNNQATQAK